MPKRDVALLKNDNDPIDEVSNDTNKNRVLFLSDDYDTIVYDNFLSLEEKSVSVVSRVEITKMRPIWGSS
jgi:hypothetical protein